VIRNDILECFILGYALEIPNNGRGHPTSITPLWLAAKERCGECEMDELLAALYNIQSDHAQIEKYVNVGAGWQVLGFDRNHRSWEDFFMVGYFNIKVLPGGRLRFQKLCEELEKELPPQSPPQPSARIGFTP
jgi:hypothetical protein